MARKNKTIPRTSLGLPADYAELLESLRVRVQQARTKAMPSGLPFIGSLHRQARTCPRRAAAVP